MGDSDQDTGYGSIARLTTLSPVRPERLGTLKRRLAFVARAPGLGRPLLDVATIHYARWIVFGSLPHPDGSDRRWWLNWKYLLFAATYDGPPEVYLNTFADILPRRLTALFGACFGFEACVENAPGADGRVFPAYAFRGFVASNKLSEAGATDRVSETARTIRQALAIERSAQRSDRLSGPALGRVGSEVVSMALGPPPREPSFWDSVVGQWTRVARPGRAVNPLTIVAPLERKLDDARGRLSGLQDTDTLFARLVVLPRCMQQHLGQQHPDRLPTDYLLLMTDYYGNPADYIESLRRRENAKAIFEHCRGFPGVRGRRGFRDWISSHSLKTQYYLAGYPARPVKDLTRLVEVRAQIAGWSLGQPDGTSPQV